MDQGENVDHLRDDGNHPLDLLCPPNLSCMTVESLPDAHRCHRAETFPFTIEVVLGNFPQLCINLVGLKFDNVATFEAPPSAPYQAQCGSPGSAHQICPGFFLGIDPCQCCSHGLLSVKLQLG